MIKLYVDDLRDCPEGYTLAKTVEEALYYLRNYKVDVLSLDHDLGEDEQHNLLPNGNHLVRTICEEGLVVNKIYIHTHNPVGRENMFESLKAAQRRGFIKDTIEIYNYSITNDKYTQNYWEDVE